MEDSLTSSKPLVLLAADDEDFLLIIELSLEHVGFAGRLQTVRSAADLTEWLRGGAIPALIILDLHCDQKELRDALTGLKANRSYESIPVVVLSTYASEGDMPLEVFPHHCYKQKPVTFEGWCACMEDILSKLHLS